MEEMVRMCVKEKILDMISEEIPYVVFPVSTDIIIRVVFPYVVYVVSTNIIL